MASTCDVSRRIEHGGHCDCELLAQAMHLDARTISFDYCRRVLQKHWRMTCRHGQVETPPAAAGSGERWHDLGPIDPVKAILISNDPT